MDFPPSGSNSFGALLWLWWSIEPVFISSFIAPLIQWRYKCQFQSQLATARHLQVRHCEFGIKHTFFYFLFLLFFIEKLPCFEVDSFIENNKMFASQFIMEIIVDL